MNNRPGSFEEWRDDVAGRISSSPLWNSIGYQKTLFLYDLVWFDCEKLIQDLRGKAIAQQLIRSIGSISANMEEGYGRGFGKDYARFLSYSLGSARETQGWYFRAKHLLSESVASHRYALVDEIIALLVTIIKQQKKTK
ncbi:MAG: four helix bundle protein [Chloroflexi bacterium]|nr:four helix bundle protein [Chloroflexota bacterium]